MIKLRRKSRSDPPKMSSVVAPQGSRKEEVDYPEKTSQGLLEF